MVNQKYLKQRQSVAPGLTALFFSANSIFTFSDPFSLVAESEELENEDASGSRYYSDYPKE